MATELWNNIRKVRLNNSASFERKNVVDNNITEKESFVIKTGDIAAESIYKSANFIRKGLSSFVEPNVTRGIEAAGDFAINQITPIEICDGTRDTNHSSVGISQSSVKATGMICSGACAVSFGLRNALGVGIRKAAEKFNDNHVGKKIIPNDDLRDTFKGVGKVGVTALGASLIVAESMFETTKAVAKTTVTVASGVVSHKYGTDAGQIVQNTGDATGNVLRTLSYFALLTGPGISTSAAKVAAKAHIEEVEENSASKTNIPAKPVPTNTCATDKNYSTFKSLPLPGTSTV